MRSSHILALGLLLALGALAIFYSWYFFRVPAPTQSPTVFTNAYALVLKNFDGEEVHLYEYRRKVLIAYAWASWCPYCADELRNLAKLRQTYGEEIQIVAINRKEPVGEAKRYIERISKESPDINLTALIDFQLDSDDAFFKTIGGYAMPETVFINEKGDIVFHQRGPIQIDEVEQKIKELLK